MIIECKSCSRKFLVKDTDIPKEGRAVQCGNCSITWHQMPTLASISTTKLVMNKNLSVDEIKASDGKTYKFLGSQWAELLSSGKTGLFAKKKIGKELDKITGRKRVNTVKKKQKNIRDVNPSSEEIDSEEQLQKVEQPKKGLGFFGYMFLIIIILFSGLGFLETFKREILIYLPESKYLFETINNIIIIIKDLFKSY